METYRDEVESYVSCQNREIEELQRKSRNAVSDYEDAVRNFNSRVR